MVSADNALELFVAKRRASLLTLAPAPDGIPELIEPAPVLVRAVYIPHDSVTEDRLVAQSQELENFHAYLMLVLASPDGPPYRTATIFTYLGDVDISWRAGSMSRHGLRAEKYLASTTGSGHAWGNDTREGGPAYFLTGSPNSANLWRITRVDVDVACRYVFTLTPVRLAQGLPSADFAKIKDDALRREAEQHWTELQDCLLRHRYYGLVTAAKNVAETLLAYFLSQAGIPFRRDLYQMLGKLRDILEDSARQTTVPFSYLDYHLVSKMRIVHAWTHPGSVVKQGRRLEPEFALTIAEDLVEVLTSAGMMQR